MKAALRSYFASLRWLLVTIARISSRQPGPFGVATVLMGVLRVMQFLVMVLPLKVVLLASHEGVPAYTPFIDPEQKSGWIIGLAIGTIVAYFFAQFLDSVARRICERAGTRLMADATALNVVPNQREQARNIFSDLASVLADLLFWAAGMVLYAVIAPTTFAVYFGLVVLSFLLGTLFAVSKTRKGFEGLHRLVTEQTNGYLSTNSTLIFFVCFLVILYPYVAGQPINMLIGLISIILLRRTLGAVFDAVRGAIKLIGKRPLVDTLMFKNRKFIPRQQVSQQQLSEMFAPAKRTVLVKAMLEGALPDKRLRSVLWTDPVVPGISTFTVHCTDKSVFLLQVYSPKNAHLPKNEDALFTYLDRAAAGAPRLVAETRYGNFTCRLLEAGDGVETAVRRWRAVAPDMVVRLASIRPSEDLVGMYRTTHLLTHERLSAEMLRRLKVAIRSDADKAALKAFTGHVEDVRKRMASLPLFISNRDFSGSCAFGTGEDLPQPMYWGRWSLEPLGAGMMSQLKDRETEAVLDRLRAARDDIGAVSLADIELAGCVQALVAAIERGSYAAALDRVIEIEAIIETGARPRPAAKKPRLAKPKAGEKRLVAQTEPAE